MISFSPVPLVGCDEVDLYTVGHFDEKNLLPKGMYLQNIFRVRKILREIKPDVIMATYVRSNGLVGALAKNAPLLVSSRGADISFPIPVIGRFVTRFVCYRADQLHAVAEELAEEFTTYGVKRDRIAVICTGIQSNIFHPSQNERVVGPSRILCTRKHWPLYDNKTIVRAVAQLRNEGVDCRLTFVGSDPHLSDTRSEVDRLGLSDTVNFAGQLSLPEVADHLRSHDVYVSASISDGTSSSLLEAICTGITPVVSAIRANQPWIEHRQSGYLFRVGDEKDCAAGIRWACENQARIIQNKVEARRMVLEKADFNANTEKIVELVEKIAPDR